MSGRLQRTVKKKVTFSGKGLHTGQEVTLHLLPAPVNSGIVFQRIDLPHQPLIPATLSNVVDLTRSTMIGIGTDSVQTIEHLMAALSAASIDNLCIQMNGAEVPIADGSAFPFVILLEEASFIEQNAPKKIYKITKPIFFSEGRSHLVALPSSGKKISYTLHYPQTKLIGSQFFSFLCSYENFKEQVASCRTFVLHEEIAHLLEQGLIKGGSVENAVVIKDDVIFSKEGLRYPDEMVRHKTLDLIGDLYLMGAEIEAHVIAICSGHRSNVCFAKEILHSIDYASQGEVYEGVCAY